MDVEKLRNNIPKVFALNTAIMFLVLIPVIVPFWRSHGLTIQQVYELQAIFGGTIILFDVPLGYVSDLFGRRACLMAVGIVNGLAFTVLALSKTFSGFAMAEILCAIAMSLYSGCDVALIYDTLEALGERMGDEVQFLGKRLFYAQIGETLASLLGGLLAAASLMLPAYANAVSAWLPFFIALTLEEPPRKVFETRRHWDNFKFIYSKLFRHSKLLTLVVVNYIAYGFATYVAVWAFQPFWTTLNIPLSMFGYLWAGFNLLVGLLGRYAHKIEARVGSVAIVLFIALLPILGYWGMATFASYVGVLLALSFPACRAFNQVILQDAINARVPSSMRATANSFASLGSRALFVCFGPVIGHAIDTKGLPTTFRSMAIIYGALFFAICLPLVAQRKNFRPVGPRA